MGGPKRPWQRVRRPLSWAVAACALAFVASVIPVRDRCWDPRAHDSTRVAVSRTATDCTLHVRSGPIVISSHECANLECEPGLATTMSRVRPGAFLGLTLLYALGTLVWAGRWRALLGLAKIDLSLTRVWRILAEAQAGGVLLPGGLGGDALRIAAILSAPARDGAARTPASIVVASVLLDRALGLSCIAGIAALLGWTAGGATAGPLVPVLASIPVGLVAALALLRANRPVTVRWAVLDRVLRRLEPVLGYMRDPGAPRAIVRAAVLSFVVAAIQFVVIRGFVWALGGEPTSERWVYVGTAMAFMIAAVPALPGGWGTADAAYVFFFGLAGLKPGLALAVCLMYRLLWYITAAVGAVLQLAAPTVSSALNSTQVGHERLDRRPGA